MRTVAGRRALHVALLVGGLFVLGILCGERAQAAEGEPPVRDAIGQVVDVPTERPREARQSTVPRDSRTGQGAKTDQDFGADQGFGAGQGSRTDQGSGAVLSELRPVAEGVVRSVEPRVVRPVGDAVETVADGLGTVAQTEVPPLEALPPLPSPPSLSSPSRPSLPSAPALPLLPDPSGMADVPGGLMPVGTDPRPGSSITVPDASDASDAAGTSDGPVASHGAAAAAHVAYGPKPLGAGAPDAAHVDTHRAVPAPSDHAPAHRAPAGDPDGTLGAGAGADHGTPRHGDAHAVTPHHRVPFRLVPGAFARADAAETRDRYRDIPVSPA